jgi:hypothetical protein
MLRFFAGVVSSLLLVAAGFFIWNGRAQGDGSGAATPGTPGAGGRAPFVQQESGLPPAATDKTREQKRFARYDKDKDGRVSRNEFLESRHKAFAKLDLNHDGMLSFDEWAAKAEKKFDEADGDRNGALSAVEFAVTKAKSRSSSSRSKKC